MDVAIIGAGYVGLVTGAGLANLGHQVRIGESNPARVAQLEAGEAPIYEQGLPDLLARATERGAISYHGSNVDAVSGAALVFLCVPTPEGEDGRADLSYVHGVIDELANEVGDDTLFVIKSTVPPGTAASLRKRLADHGSQARLVSHPEFLREGKAVEDFMKPDRIVVGAYERSDAEMVSSLYRTLDSEVVFTDPTSAEMIKYANNAYLAARLTFANALANVCEAVGADVLDVIHGIGLDHRIGPHFLQPGPGYGGSCFPKDTAALIGVAGDAGYDFQLLKAVIEADHQQRRRVAEKVRQAAGGDLHRRRIAMWGVAFKAGTDDVRESPAIRIARLLQDEGAEVVAYDPEAHSDELTMADDPIAAVTGAEVLLIATEWPEFGTVDMNQVAAAMKGHRVVDARNLLDSSMVRAAGLDYWGLGRPSA
ncbi:MAG TPA: UDP-glucose/GDP-mannose dehydrogenase family protein [Acidimicrobiia bacterium]|nr:UDP-glucose/GDP-mannose dehydrogenase family protein [Acidimicrobiia bacterium]